MAFNVNKFLAHFDSHAGFARSSKFEVRIALPPTLVGFGSTEELSLQCESAEIPGYTLNTVESKIFGAPTYLAGVPSFGDITLTFICAGDLWEKKFFDAWMDMIIPKSTYLVNYKESYQTGITIHQFSDYMTSSKERKQEEQPDFLKDVISQSANKLIDQFLTKKLPSVSKALTGINNEKAFQELQTKANPPPDAYKSPEIFSCKLINAFPITVNALPLNWGTDDIHRLSVVFKYDKWLNTTAGSPVNLPPTQKIPGTDSAGQKNYRGTVLRDAAVNSIVDFISKKGKF